MVPWRKCLNDRSRDDCPRLPRHTHFLVKTPQDQNKESKPLSLECYGVLIIEGRVDCRLGGKGRPLFERSVWLQIDGKLSCGQGKYYFKSKNGMEDEAILLCGCYDGLRRSVQDD